MSIRMQCEGCSRNISVDDAFAGSVCRCPYCKALVVVPGSPGAGSSGPRPEAPVVRPESPQAPAEAAPVAHADGPAAPAEPAPQAAGGRVAVRRQRARVRRNMTFLALVAGLLVIALGGVLYILMTPEEPVSNTPQPEGPERIDGPHFAHRIPVRSPVIFVIDAGGSMRGHFDAATQAVFESALSLGEQGQFRVLVSREAEIVGFRDGMAPGSEADAGAAKDWLTNIMAGGATEENLPAAIRQAMAERPAMVVVVAAKEIDGEALAREAREAGVPISTVSMVAYPEVVENLKQLAESAGGRSAVVE